MSQESLKSVHNRERRQFIGGSDARIIMGEDEAALLRLWRENEARSSRRISPATLSSSSASRQRILIVVGMRQIPVR